MGKQRKYLDAGRRIALDGRPIEPDWVALLWGGRGAVKNDRVGVSPHLDPAMWEGLDPLVHHPRAAAQDYPLLREWLHVDEAAATAFLREQWGMIRAPEDREEALEMMSRPDCFEAGLGTHRLTADRSVSRDDWGMWAVGPCHDCFRTLLWLFPADGERIQSWPFYDQEAEYEGSTGADRR